MELNIGIVNSNSINKTMCKNIWDGEYNPARAHLNNVLSLVKNLGDNVRVYDIGESKCYESPDDVHELCQAYSIPIEEVTLNEYRTLSGIKLTFFLYIYPKDEDIPYFQECIKASDHIIYYASDDELYYKGYFLERWVQNFDLFDRSKLVMILSGHSYFSKCPELATHSNMYHFPMFPNPIIRRKCDDLIRRAVPRTDFFVNCHHHSKLMEDIIRLMPNRTFTIFTNTAVKEYFDKKYRPRKRLNFLVSEKANSPLLDIVKEVLQCKYYWIPNTYYHYSNWYKDGHYMQSVMYTHKALEAYFADRLVLGDLTEGNIKELNKLEELPFISRSEYFKTEKDPMIETIKKCQSISKSLSNLIKSNLKI